MNREDVLAVVVGAGPAGLLAALHASRAGRVLLIDSGADLAGRLSARRHAGDQRSVITSGFGGAGLFSDGKLCLSHRIGSTVAHRFAPDEVERRQVAIDELLRGPLEAPLLGADSAAADEMVREAARNGLEYLHYPVRHIGSDQLPLMLAGLQQRLAPSVEFAALTPCLEVRPSTAGRHPWDVHLGGGQAGRIVNTPNVVLAPGKIGSGWMTRVGIELGLERRAAEPKIGFRLEGPKRFLDPLLAVANDPKLIWRGPHGAEARTHCVCYGGDVVPAAYEDLLLVGGHSTSEHCGDRSNCAVIATAGTALPLTPEDARDIVRRINVRHGGRVVAQRLGDFLQPEETRAQTRAGVGWEGGGFQPSIPNAESGDLAADLPAPIVGVLRDFLRQLAALCPSVAAADNLIYGPAVERWAHRFVVSDEMEAAPGLFLAGDGPGLTGGIIAAADTGWLAGQAIASRTS